MIFAAVSESFAQQPCINPRPQDEIWEISTRCLPCSLSECQQDKPDFSPSQFLSGEWQRCSFDAFLAHLHSNSTPRTIIYTHGNWMTHSNSRGRSSYVYNRVAARSTEAIRFISFTWPSNRSGRPVRDVREKAGRSEVDAFYFAALLNHFPRNAPLGLMGFSFGARVCCGGLHLVNGGVLNGRRLSGRYEPFPMLRISLVAPAFDRNWLAAESRYGRSLDGVDKLVNLYNSRDPVLKRYRFIDAVAGPIAAGFAGITGVAANTDPRSTEPLNLDPRITQFDCFDSIGNTHHEMSYYSQCPRFQFAIDNVLGK